ncbi:MAG: hypothetical protein N2515_07675, partial [Deltaproteobacteria bacterium]|nr:hypothetical protein [Deltaproteobacteria bacterium]
PFVVRLLYRGNNPFVFFHLNQSFWYQLAVIGVLLGIAFVFLLLSVVTCGVGSLLFYLLPLISLALGTLYPLYVAYRAYQGEWEFYPIIGEKVLDQERPLIRP